MRIALKPVVSCLRCGLAALAALLGSSAAASETPTVQLGSTEVKPYVLIQLDEGSTFNQDRSGGQAAGFNLRRARLGAEADVAHQVQLGFVWDFGGTPGNHSRLYEAQVAYVGFKPFSVTAGAFKPSFTLEYAQSSADILFLERASIVNIVGSLVAGSGRVVPGAVAASGDRWLAEVLLTGGTTGPGANSEQRAVLGRAAGLVVKRGDLAVHLGLSGAWLFQPPRPGRRGSVLSFSNQPELAIDDAPASLSTGSFAARSAELGGIEAGVGWGQLWLQGEWYGIGVDRPRSDGGLFFSGWYAQAAYTLFGTPRRWTSKTASWGVPSPDRGFDPAHGAWGALEVGARFSIADLDSADIRGGRQRVWTAGVSWYPVDPLRFVLQYEHADIAGGQAPRSLDAVAFRGQVAF